MEEGLPGNCQQKPSVGTDMDTVAFQRLDTEELMTMLECIRKERDLLAAQLKKESTQYTAEVSAWKRKLTHLEQVHRGELQAHGPPSSSLDLCYDVELVHHVGKDTESEGSFSTGCDQETAEDTSVDRDTVRSAETHRHDKHPPATSKHSNITAGKDTDNTAGEDTDNTIAVDRGAPENAVSDVYCIDCPNTSEDTYDVKPHVCGATGTVHDGADDEESISFPCEFEPVVKFEPGTSQESRLQEGDAKSSSLASVDPLVSAAAGIVNSTSSKEVSHDMDCDTSHNKDWAQSADTTQQPATTDNVSQPDSTCAKKPRHGWRNRSRKLRPLKCADVSGRDASVADDTSVKTPRRQGNRSLRKPHRLKQHIDMELRKKKEMKAKKKPFACPDCGVGFNARGSLYLHMRKKGIQPFKCEDCSAGFDKIKELRAHRITHTGLKPHKCTHCDAAYSQSGQLKVHMLFHLNIRPHQCTLCGYRFHRRGNLNIHMKTHVGGGEKPYQCATCGKRFSGAFHLKHHMNRHTHEIKFTCTVCNGVFYSKADMQVHMKIHKEKSYLCPHCGRRFSQASGLKCHMAVHSDKRPYKCSECGDTFVRSYCLKEHQYIHTGRRDFKCSICGACFAAPSHLRKHKRAHAGKVHKCPLCGAGFTQGHSMNKHMRKHFGDQPNKCSQCDTYFPSLGQLNKHLLTHTDQSHANTDDTNTNKTNTEQANNATTTYLCDMCGASFNNSSNLAKHAKVHKDQTTHDIHSLVTQAKVRNRQTTRNHSKQQKNVCNFCGASFKCPRSLANHRKSRHKDKNPHKCSECNASFLHARTLQKHVEDVHSSKKPEKLYECKVCNASFTQQRGLNAHMVTHKMELPFNFKCGVCGRAFAVKKYLRKHVLRMHSDEGSEVQNGADGGHSVQHVVETDTDKRQNIQNVAETNADQSQSMENAVEVFTMLVKYENP